MVTQTSGRGCQARTRAAEQIEEYLAQFDWENDPVSWQRPNEVASLLGMWPMDGEYNRTFRVMPGGAFAGADAGDRSGLHDHRLDEVSTGGNRDTGEPGLYPVQQGPVGDIPESGVFGAG